METTIALLVFGVCYVFFITEKLNRAVVACAGGIVLIFFGVYDLTAAFEEYIDWKTISLLFSMMVLVSITSKTGVFEFIAIKVAQLVRGKPIPLLIMIGTLTAFGSAFLDNVTTVLLFAPILLTLTSMLSISPLPYLIVMIISSNIGGTATLIGDPPNIMIGQAVDHLTFNDFLVNLAPIVALTYVVVILCLAYYFRKKLHVPAENRKELMKVDASKYLKKTPTLYKSLLVLGMTIAGFMLHPVVHIELTLVAMAGALLLLLLTYKHHSVEETFKSVEWVTLFFFIGLFMIVGGLERAGVIDELAKEIMYQTKGDLPKTALFILWITGLFSGFIDNIPFVAAMIPVIFEFQDYGMNDVDPLWWALALGACLGGNGTLIGSSANVVVAGIAASSKHPIGFIDFLKVGFGIVLISLVLSTVYLYFRYLVPFI